MLAPWWTRNLSRSQLFDTERISKKLLHDLPGSVATALAFQRLIDRLPSYAVGRTPGIERGAFSDEGSTHRPIQLFGSWNGKCDGVSNVVHVVTQTPNVVLCNA